MTDLLKQLDAAVELGRKATARPWTARSRTGGDFAGLVTSGSRKAGEQVDICYMARGSGCPDHDYIPAAANLDHAAVAAELRRLQAIEKAARDREDAEVAEAISHKSGTPEQQKECYERAIEASKRLIATLTPAAGADHA